MATEVLPGHGPGGGSGGTNFTTIGTIAFDGTITQGTLAVPSNAYQRIELSFYGLSLDGYPASAPGAPITDNLELNLNSNGATKAFLREGSYTSGTSPHVVHYGSTADLGLINAGGMDYVGYNIGSYGKATITNPNGNPAYGPSGGTINGLWITAETRFLQGDTVTQPGSTIAQAYTSEAVSAYRYAAKITGITITTKSGAPLSKGSLVRVVGVTL